PQTLRRPRGLPRPDRRLLNTHRPRNHTRHRRLTSIGASSRQNPDRASPARPRREHTPRRSVRAAPGPGPRGPVARGARSCITLMRPPRFFGPLEGSRDPVAPDEEIYIALILRPCAGFRGPVASDVGIYITPIPEPCRKSRSPVALRGRSCIIVHGARCAAVCTTPLVSQPRVACDPEPGTLAYQYLRHPVHNTSGHESISPIRFILDAATDK